MMMLMMVMNHDGHEPGVGFEKLDYVWMFEHVTYGGLSLQVVQGEAGGGGELGHVHHLGHKHEHEHKPMGDEVNFATSTT